MKKIASELLVERLIDWRVDTKIDERLSHNSPLRGRVAIANAAVAFATYQRAIAAERWHNLSTAGARPQRPLWASTGTKSDAYSDVLYVESLVAPDVINTMPQATLDAFADHGRTNTTLDDDTVAAGVLRGLARAGIDLAAELESEGITSFSDSYDQLLTCIDKRGRELAAPPASAHGTTR